jgi:hypothetical protein
VSGSRQHAFRAEIHTQGPNPYVDVPQRVSAALASHATAGRVPVEGKVRGALFRATLIPVGGGRQRLYLPGGCARRPASASATQSR